MDWRVGLGKLAVKLGVDPDEAVARAEQLAKDARTLAENVAEQAAPIAKDVAARLQSAAELVAAEVADRIEKARQSQPPSLPPATPDTNETPVPTVRVPRTPPAAASTKAPVASAPTGKPHAVQATAGAALDLTGLSVTWDDAKELARIPEGMHQAVLANVTGESPVPVELAESIRAYVAATPQTIFEADDRIRKDASALADRTGMRHGQLVGIWNGVGKAAHLLQLHDAMQGTDFAASSWLAMLGSWSFPQIKNDHGDLVRAVGTAIQLASKSPRPYAHAEQLCNLILAAAQDQGWPTALFADPGVVDDFLAVVRSAVDQPTYRDSVAEHLLTLVRAVMATQVRDSELGRLSMHPHVFRAEFGKAGAAVLQAFGREEAATLRDAAEGLSRSQAQASADELREIERYPRWLSESAVASNPRQYAHDTMTEAQALELATFVRSARGDLGQLGWRLETLWRTPSTCAALAERFGVEAQPPRNGNSTPNLLSQAAKVTENTQNSLLMLLAYDRKHGTRHVVDAASSLLAQVKHGENTHNLVTAARTAFASGAATADEKKHFIRQIPRLIDAGAWPGVNGRNDAIDISALLKGVTDLAKSDETFASEIFVSMFKVTNKAVVSEPASVERRVDDLVGRAAVAAFTSELATALGRGIDAANFSHTEQGLRSELQDS